MTVDRNAKYRFRGKEKYVCVRVCKFYCMDVDLPGLCFWWSFLLADLIDAGELLWDGVFHQLMKSVDSNY